MNERFEHFSFAIAEIYKCWHKIATDELGPHGLSSSHALYLIHLLHHPEGVTAVRLSELSGKDKSDVSRMASTLEKKGFLSKEGSNPYRALLRLTEAGVDAATHVEQRAVLAVDCAGGEVSPEDRKVFYRVLDTILNNLQVISREGLPESGTL